MAAGIGSSADTALQPLAQSLASLSPFETSLNKAGAATLTHSSSYPSGVPLILRVYPKTGETFQGWKDASGAVLSTKATYRTNMPAGPLKIWAAFQGGTTGLGGRSQVLSDAPIGAEPAPARDALGRARGGAGIRTPAILTRMVRGG